MRPVYIEAQDVASLRSLTRNIAVELNMTTPQIKRAVVDMLGGMPESDAFEFLRSEFPEWFEVTA